MPEDRAVLENEIARLRSENVTLKKEILAHGLALPAGAMPETAGAGDGSLTLRLPDNADVDHAWPSSAGCGIGSSRRSRVRKSKC